MQAIKKFLNIINNLSGEKNFYFIIIRLPFSFCTIPQTGIIQKCYCPDLAKWDRFEKTYNMIKTITFLAPAGKSLHSLINVVETPTFMHNVIVYRQKNNRNNWIPNQLSTGLYIYQLQYNNLAGELKRRTGKLLMIE